MGVLVTLIVVLIAGSPPARADVITGDIVGWVESSPYIQVGDGVNHVSMWWSLSTTNWGWFYGSNFAAHDTDVAVASGVTDISQITDASAFAFSSGAIGTYCDASCTGTGTFLVWRNIATSYYGVLRVDDITPGDIHVAALNGTWWFQDDGTDDFSGASTVPEPATLVLLGSGLVAAGFARRRRR